MSLAFDPDRVAAPESGPHESFPHPVVDCDRTLIRDDERPHRTGRRPNPRILISSSFDRCVKPEFAQRGANTLGRFGKRSRTNDRRRTGKLVAERDSHLAQPPSPASRRQRRNQQLDQRAVPPQRKFKRRNLRRHRIRPRRSTRTRPRATAPPFEVRLEQRSLDQPIQPPPRHIPMNPTLSREVVHCDRRGRRTCEEQSPPQLWITDRLKTVHLLTPLYPSIERAGSDGANRDHNGELPGRGRRVRRTGAARNELRWMYK